MKGKLLIALLAGAILGGPCLQSSAFAQTCGDEEAMVKDYQQSITDLVATVKKESLDDFEKGYHQRSCLTKLTLCANIIDGLLECLKKPPEDATAPKEQADAARTKEETYAKLKAKVGQWRDSLKSIESSKDAKAFIGKIAFVP